MRFSLFGFPVIVQPMFWLVTLMLSPPADFGRDALARFAIWVAIVFVSVLVHELGHAFAMRAFGRSPSIALVGMGGLTHWGEGPRVSPQRRALVSLAGPGAGFALAVPIVILWIAKVAPEGSLGAYAIEQAFFVNVIWGLLNLLPILPLDGGHVMEVVVIGATGAARGAKIARGISLAACAGAFVLALSYGYEWGAVMAFILGLSSARELAMPHGGRDGSMPESKKPLPLDPSIESAIEASWAAIRSGHARQAIEAAEAHLAGLPDEDASAPARARLIETIAWGLIEEGEDRQAIAAVRRMPPRYRPSELLAARLQLAAGATDEGFRAMEKAYLETPGDLAALVLGAAWIDHRAPARAVAMLRGLRGMKVSSDAHNTIAAALFYAEHFGHALEVSELAWNRYSDPIHAYNAACSAARLGKLDEALVWLGRAVDRGFSDRTKVESDSDLALLREDPRFAEILRRLRSR